MMTWVTITRIVVATADVPPMRGTSELINRYGKEIKKYVSAKQKDDADDIGGCARCYWGGGAVSQFG